MNIGFDAKRAFHNSTGLGHYSRSLLQSLAEFYPQHQYYLFNPKPSRTFSLTGPGLHEIRPSGFFSQTFPGAWRSSWVKKDLRKLRIDLYHGLSHEIPVGIRKTGIRSVVTIHDLIHERYPEQYHPVDVRIYRAKFRYACAQADHIIAISEQTRNDIIRFYGSPENKISVCYQSCNPRFTRQVGEAEKQNIKSAYGLPDSYFLYVGSLIERKNLMNVVKALHILKDDLKIPLVVIGDGGKYKRKVKQFLRDHNEGGEVIFLSEREESKHRPGYQTAADFPAIYQSAIALVYPSFFEGFGIPVLEALWSRLPVITSNLSCLPEAGGEGAYYVNPASPEEIAAGMKKIWTDKNFAASLAEKGWAHAQGFTPQMHAASVMNVYESLC